MKARGRIMLVIMLVIAAALSFVSYQGIGEGKTLSAGNIKQGLDLSGGVYIVYEADKEDVTAEEMQAAVSLIQGRMDWNGWTEAEVAQEGTNRIRVDIPGVENAEEAIREIGQTAQLSFVDETGKVLLTGDMVADATKQVGATQKGGNAEPYVALKFNDEGKQLFAEATAANIGKPIYIVMDGEVISAPMVQSAITTGEASITGNFTGESAEELASLIRAGSLPFNLNVIQMKNVGARLGADALATGVKAGAIGLALVLIFMLVVYKVLGFAADLALIIYVGLELILLNAFNITLTLPGIAGIILSVGMAVDANVIIFTRIREEIAAGKNVREAIKIGFGKALSAVIDGNITTLIAAAVLYLKGTGTIKGFAITLALGIVLSMFTALVITRFVLMALYGIGFKDAKFYGKQKEAKVKNFCGMKKITYVIAVICICAGFVSMGVHASAGNKALNYSLDFTGGTAMTVNFKDYLEVPGSDEDDLRKLFESEAGTTDIQFQNVSGSPEIVIKTPVLDPEHRAAVKDALMEKYALEQSDITEENISGTISGEMRTNAILSVIIAGIFIMIYIWVRFRDIKFGAGAIIALLHDVLVVLAVYSIARIPVGTTFIACMLTIVGYSINATIVVYDRIRENSHTMVKATTEEIVNTSISQTLSRSINTSLTTLIMVLLIYIMGVTSIKEFALPMMAGIIAGTFSSVFISGTIWAVMKGKKK